MLWSLTLSVILSPSPSPASSALLLDIIGACICAVFTLIKAASTFSSIPGYVVGLNGLIVLARCEI